MCPCFCLLLTILSYNIHNEEIQAVESQQVSLILGANFVISFQGRIGDVFEPIPDRIRNAKGRIRKMEPDFL